MKQFLILFVKEAVESVNTSPMYRDEVIKFIFDNIRNTSLVGLVYWAGLILSYRPDEFFPYIEMLMGLFLMVSALFLFLINVVHGIKKIIELATHKTAAIIISAVFYITVCAFMSAIARTKLHEVNPIANSNPITQIELLRG